LQEFPDAIIKIYRPDLQEFENALCKGWKGERTLHCDDISTILDDDENDENHANECDDESGADEA